MYGHFVCLLDCCSQSWNEGIRSSGPGVNMLPAMFGIECGYSGRIASDFNWSTISPIILKDCGCVYVWACHVCLCQWRPEEGGVFPIIQVGAFVSHLIKFLWIKLQSPERTACAPKHWVLPPDLVVIYLFPTYFIYLIYLFIPASKLCSFLSWLLSFFI